jgi:protein arginine N-methyltransferase 1
MVENVLDLRDRALRPGGRIVPAKFALFVEPVSMHRSMAVRRFWNIDLPDGIDLSAIERSPIAERFRSDRSEQYWVRPRSVASTIGDPKPILEFDLATLPGIEALATEHVIERTAHADAIIDGIAIWFEARFDDETTLSTSPLDPVTSWGNRVYRVDREIARGETIRVRVGMSRLVDPNTWTVEPLSA